jgi:hypothetical protein
MNTRTLRYSLLSALLLLACNRTEQSAADGQNDELAVAADAVEERRRADVANPAAAPPPQADFAGKAIAIGAAARAPTQTPAAALPDSVRPPMLIRNGAATIRVDSVGLAIAAVRALAERLGGYVPNVAIQSGEQQTREATLTLRIPSARFDDALTGLQPIGKVEAVHVSSEDVGEEYFDIEVRLANGRRLEQRLLTLLEQRTGSLEDVLAVERELARVRQEIEQLEGRLRYLRNRVDMSTLAVTVHEPGPILANVGENVIVRALKQAVRNFVNLVAAFIAALGVLLPMFAVLAGGWLWWRRRQRQRRLVMAAPPVVAESD